MPLSTVTSKGQVTIPKQVRDALHLQAGDRLDFQLRDDGSVVLRPQSVDLLSIAGCLKPSKRGVSIEAMQEAVLRSHRRP